MLYFHKGRQPVFQQMQGLVNEVKEQWKSESDKIDSKLDTLIQLEREKLQLEREKLEMERIKLGLNKPSSTGGMFSLQIVCD